jgi:hypothetical protein
MESTAPSVDSDDENEDMDPTAGTDPDKVCMLLYTTLDVIQTRV